MENFQPKENLQPNMLQDVPDDLPDFLDPDEAVDFLFHLPSPWMLKLKKQRRPADV